MRARRVAALLVATALLHLSAVAGNAECPALASSARSADAGLPAPGADAAEHAEHHAIPAVAAGLAAPQGDLPPCESPAGLHGCDLMAGCSIAGGIAAVDERCDRASRVRQQIPAFPHDAPASFTAAPEPPPPKA